MWFLSDANRKKIIEGLMLKGNEILHRSSIFRPYITTRSLGTGRPGDDLWGSKQRARAVWPEVIVKEDHWLQVSNTSSLSRQGIRSWKRDCCRFFTVNEGKTE
jgi:hypothetical protein